MELNTFGDLKPYSIYFSFCVLSLFSGITGVHVTMFPNLDSNLF